MKGKGKETRSEYLKRYREQNPHKQKERRRIEVRKTTFEKWNEVRKSTSMNNDDLASLLLKTYEDHKGCFLARHQIGSHVDGTESEMRASPLILTSTPGEDPPMSEHDMCSTNVSCPATVAQNEDEFYKAQDHSSSFNMMFNSKVQNNREVEGQEAIMEREIHHNHLPSQKEIPYHPLHKTLRTKGRKHHIQRDNLGEGQNHRNHLHVPREGESSGNLEVPCKDLSEVQNDHDHLQAKGDILKSPLRKTLNVRSRATNVHDQGSGMAGDVTLQHNLTHRNLRIPALDKIVDRLRMVNKSKETSSVELDVERHKHSPCQNAAGKVTEEESVIDEESKSMIPSWSYGHPIDMDSPATHAPQVKSAHTKDSIGASRLSKRKRKRAVSLLKKVEKSVENHLAEKRCLVVENLVVGEAFVVSANSNHVPERPQPPGQQCAVCKEHVPQESLNSHRCKVGVSKKKPPIQDEQSLDKSPIQESDRCKVCQRTLGDAESVDGKKQLRCKECTGTADQRSSVSVSENVVGGIHKCDRCEQSFSSRSNLSLHLLSHVEVKVHMCEACDKTFPTESMLMTHKRIHAGQHPYQCHICNRTFGKSNTLTCHLRTHSGEKPYQCDLCDKSFTQNSALTVHKRIHSGEQPFRCELCGKSFRDKSNLRRHVRTHIGDQPFECSVCGKRFSTKDHLNTHFRIHTGDKPYQCNMCDKAFTQSSTLVGHMRTHTGELPHKCDVCHKGFRDQRRYSSHMKLHAEDSK